MFSLLSFLAPAALLLPDAAQPAPPQEEARLSVPEGEVKQASSDTWLEALGFERMVQVPIAKQVRIERRVTIRIAPRRSQAQQNLAAQLIDAQGVENMAERKIGECIPMRGIAGVQAERGNRLIFFMRDQRIVSARLEKACRSEAFYSGFYIEPSEDGNLCVDRDVLRSRSGVNCEVDRIRQLVRARN